MRALEGREIDYCWLVFGWLNSDMVQLVKELPLTAMDSSEETGQDGSTHRSPSKDYLR